MSKPICRRIHVPLLSAIAAAFLVVATSQASSSLAANSVLAAAQSASAASPVRLNPRHPDRYVVQKGDTLWDISAMFLRDPWFWPEIWYANPQVHNPHLIFPGDVLSLVYMDGRPRIILERGVTDRPAGTDRLQPQVRADQLEDAIFTIPYDRIAAFLSRPAVLDRATVDRAPYILTSRRGHLVHGANSEVYVRGGSFGQGDLFSVMHVGEPLRDPDSGRMLGFQAQYVGEGSIVRNGDPATLFLSATAREALNGDKLFPVETDFPLRFTPRPPETSIEGRIIHVLDGVQMAGAYQIVTLNRGARHGLETGHVLSVWQAGERVPDRFGGGHAQLPDEYAGLLMVFRTFDEISFGLIMRASNEMRVLDRVRNP